MKTLQQGKRWLAPSLAAVSTLGLVLALPGATTGKPAGQNPEADAGDYLGKSVCADCHQDRFSQHAGSNFDRSWRPASALPAEAFPLEVHEGVLTCRVEAEHGEWVYRVRLGDRPWQTFPIHSIIGGDRFGLSFILRLTELESRPLPRPVFVEARYMLDASNRKLKLSPGFPSQPPRNYETALGRVLTPLFARKCFDCHGGIADPALARQGGPHPVFQDVGVGCERCHGPGRAHVAAIEEGADDLRIVNPAKLSAPEIMKLCGRCHSGFFPTPHPRPSDLMISNQATALSSSNCYQRSGGAFSCVACHDPHGNARADSPAYEETCRSCHDSGKNPETPVCPVNPVSGCLPCHMPNVNLAGDFPVTDHWIRVFPR